MTGGECVDTPGVVEVDSHPASMIGSSACLPLIDHLSGRVSLPRRIACHAKYFKRTEMKHRHSPLNVCCSLISLKSHMS